MKSLAERLVTGSILVEVTSFFVALFSCYRVDAPCLVHML